MGIVWYRFSSNLMMRFGVLSATIWAINSAASAMQIAERFGAKVSLALPGMGLFLLVANDPGGLDALVRGAGGRVAARLDTSRALVVMGLTSYMGLRGSRAVRFIGPVNVDQQRFAAVLAACQAVPPGVLQPLPPIGLQPT